jgi:methionyl-tRNA formyltransferase
MVICIAGKNNIAIDMAEAIVQLSQTGNKKWKIVGIPNGSDTGIDGFQQSYRKWLNIHSIPIVTLESIYGKKDLLFLSLEFDRIINPELFMSSRLYNIHFSLLPKYRGMYTSALPILFGETITGVTLHKIDKGIDTGDIIDHYYFPILSTDNCRDLYCNYIKYGSYLVKKNLANILEDKISAIPQDYDGASYFSRSAIDYKNLSIDLEQCAYNIRNQIRAFNFREYQLPQINGEYIIDCVITKNRSFQRPGYIHFINDTGIYISTIDYDCILYRDRFGQLLEACIQGNLSVVQNICVVRQHLFERDEHGWTALMVAVYNGHGDIVKWLLSQGADAFAVNNHGTNMLMYSKETWIRTRDSSLFDLFFKMGLNIHQCDSHNRSLVDYCHVEGILKIGNINIPKYTPPQYEIVLIFIFLYEYYNVIKESIFIQYVSSTGGNE